MRASSAPFGRGSKNQKFSLLFLFLGGGVGGADKKWKGNFWFCFAATIYHITTWNITQRNTIIQIHDKNDFFKRS